MSKIDFINNFSKICNELGLSFEPRFEHGMKVSNNSINIDRVNIGFSEKDITKDNLLYIIGKLFDDVNSVNKFIENIYNNHKNKIQQIFLGYSNGSTEIYFECFEPGESSYCVSYNSTDKQQNEYQPLTDHELIINELVDLIKEKTSLIISEPNEIFKGGFVKGGNIYYILTLEPMSKVGSILKSLCYNINLNEKETIDKWFEEHQSKTVSNIAYTIKNNQLILNIYVNEPRTT